MNLLLDTHAFIWWDDDYGRLPVHLLSLLQNPEHTIYLSVVSIWEMQIKIQLGKLKFDLPLPQKIREHQKRNNMQLLTITTDQIFALDNLPNHHRDPFDRLLIAQAQTENLTLVTRDSRIHQYDVKVIWDKI